MCTKIMTAILCTIFVTTLGGCAKQSTDPTPAAMGLVLKTVNGFDNVEEVTIGSNQAFIRWPKTQVAGPQKWVWYAPTFLSDIMGPTPMPQQVGWYFEQLSEAGIVVIGMDVGESFGSPHGRDLFEEFYQYLQTRGFESHGCMILQSRGGLMGYSWMLDHPGRVKCVAGIYPLTTVTDYVGLDYMANVWGVTSAWLQTNIATESPLEHRSPLTGVNVYHLHGDADVTVHLVNDQLFVSQLASGSLTVVPGEGHEFYSDEFFHSQTFLNFLLTNLQ